MLKVSERRTGPPAWLGQPLMWKRLGKPRAPHHPRETSDWHLIMVAITSNSYSLCFDSYRLFAFGCYLLQSWHSISSAPPLPKSWWPSWKSPLSRISPRGSTRIISRPPKKDRPGLGLRFAFVWFSQMPSSSICIYDDENMLMKNMRMQIWW